MVFAPATETRHRVGARGVRRGGGGLRPGVFGHGGRGRPALTDVPQHERELLGGGRFGRFLGEQFFDDRLHAPVLAPDSVGVAERGRHFGADARGTLRGDRPGTQQLGQASRDAEFIRRASASRYGPRVGAGRARPRRTRQNVWRPGCPVGPRTRTCAPTSSRSRPPPCGSFRRAGLSGPTPRARPTRRVPRRSATSGKPPPHHLRPAMSLPPRQTCPPCGRSLAVAGRFREYSYQSDGKGGVPAVRSVRAPMPPPERRCGVAHMTTTDIRLGLAGRPVPAPRPGTPVCR